MAYYDKITRRVTLSFVLSTERNKGDLAHNSRTRTDGGVRKRGVKERRSWNVYKDVRARNDKEVVDVLTELYGDRLDSYNEKQLQDGRPGRMITMEQWYDKQRASRQGGGGMKRGYEEFVLGLGDKFTASQYLYAVDSKNRAIDKDGNVIEEWQTNKQLVPVRDDAGKPIKSARYEAMIGFLTDVYEVFKRETPEVVSLGLFIHADEYGQIHAHVNYVCPVKNKDGIGIRLSPTDCYRHICDRLGLRYKNARKGSAKEVWTTYMRENVLPALMKKHGFERISGDCAGKKHETVEEHKRTADRRAAKTDAEMKRKREELVSMERQVEQKKNELERKTEQSRNEIQKREQAVFARENSITSKEAAVATKERELNAKHTEIENEKKRLAADKAAVERDRETVRKTQQQVKETLREAEEKRDRFLECSRLVSNNVKIVERREKAVANREAAARKREQAAEQKLNEADRKVQEAERKVAENAWIVEKVLSEHPEWLKERELYEFVLDNVKKERKTSNDIQR